MKFNKNQFIRITRGQFNCTRKFFEFNIRERAWDENKWQIVDSEDFDTANIIVSFYYRDELWDYIKNNSKRKI